MKYLLIIMLMAASCTPKKELSAMKATKKLQTEYSYNGYKIDKSQR